MRDHAHALAAAAHADDQHVAMVLKVKAQALRLLRQVALEARVLRVVGEWHGRVGHGIEADHSGQAGDQRFGIRGQRVAGRFLRLRADRGGVGGESGGNQQAEQGQAGKFLEHGAARGRGTPTLAFPCPLSNQHEFFTDQYAQSRFALSCAQAVFPAMADPAAMRG